MHVQMTAICNPPIELYFLIFNAYLCILFNLLFPYYTLAMLLYQNSFHIIYSKSGKYGLRLYDRNCHQMFQTH